MTFGPCGEWEVEDMDGNLHLVRSIEACPERGLPGITWIDVPQGLHRLKDGGVYVNLPIIISESIDQFDERVGKPQIQDRSVS